MNNTKLSAVSTITLAASLMFGCGREETDNSAPAGASETEVTMPAKQPPPEIQVEIAKLQGTWTGVSFHVDGFNDRVALWYRYTFDGDQMTTETDEFGPTAVKFYLKPNADPKQLDTSIMVDGREEISKGIYEVDGDTLKLSWRVVGDRPTDFGSKDGDEKIVLFLRRPID